MKIGSLRQHGVTLHLQLTSDRSPVPDVPAIYFVSATEESIQRISSDISNGLYESFYLNFVSHIPNPYMELLAESVVKSQCVPKVNQVVDRYLKFVSLSPTEFTLNERQSFSILHGNASDTEIEAYIERIVDGLFSALATIKVLPIIRCPGKPNSPANMIATRLESRIRRVIHRDASALSQLFGTSKLSAQRPILILLDRELDLNVMVHHTWTYQALIHDLLGSRSNRVKVTSTDKTGATTTRNYDLDSADRFWIQYCGSTFQEAAAAVSEMLSEYNKKMASIQQNEGYDPQTHDSGDFRSATAGLTNAINALPEMTEKKRSIDMHTNIASALVNEIKARELDKYYEVEDDVERGSVSGSMSQMEQLLKAESKGTLADKTRALVCYFLSKTNLSVDRVNKLKAQLTAIGGNSTIIDNLEHLKSLRAMQRDLESSSMTASFGAEKTKAAGLSAVTATQAAAALGDIGRGVLDRGMGFLQGVRELLPQKKYLPICKICEALLDQKSSPVTDLFLYLDPKVSAVGSEVPRMRAPFKHGIIFTVGGGNFVESQALKEMAQKTGQRQLIYGSTDMISPEEFLNELLNIKNAI